MGFEAQDSTGGAPPGSSSVTTVNPGGTTNYLTKWTPTGTQLGDSPLYDSSGKIGLGLINPTANFQIKSGTNFSGAPILLLQNSSVNASFQFTDDGNVYINSPQYTGFALQVGGSNVMQYITLSSTEVAVRIPNNFNYRRTGDDFYIGGCDTNRWFFQDASGSKLTPDTIALVEMSSTTKGLLLPRMTTTQKNAITTTNKPGLMVYDITLDGVYCTNNAGAWVAL